MLFSREKKNFFSSKETPVKQLSLEPQVAFLRHSGLFQKEITWRLLLLSSCWIVFSSLHPHELQPGFPVLHSLLDFCSNSCPLSWWCHPTISSSVIPFSSCLQSLPASGSFPMSQFFTSGGQSTGASASASRLPMNTQGLSPLGWTGWISLQSKGLSRVFSNTTVQKHQFFNAQPSFWSNSHIPTWLLEKP